MPQHILHLEWVDLFSSVWLICKNLSVWFCFKFPSLLISRAFFHMFNGDLSLPFREVSVFVFCSFFSILCLLLIHKCSLYIFGISLLSWMCCRYIYPSSWGQVFYEVFWWIIVFSFNVAQSTNLLFYVSYVLRKLSLPQGHKHLILFCFLKFL